MDDLIFVLIFLAFGLLSGLGKLKEYWRIKKRQETARSNQAQRTQRTGKELAIPTAKPATPTDDGWTPVAPTPKRRRARAAQPVPPRPLFQEPVQPQATPQQRRVVVQPAKAQRTQRVSRPRPATRTAQPAAAQTAPTRKPQRKPAPRPAARPAARQAPARPAPRQRVQPRTQPAKQAPRRRPIPRPAPRPAPTRRPARAGFFANLADVRRGIILQEVLGPPRGLQR
ncbi:MAG: hypothetical protein GWP08_17195 [Nitrospiraceae bacterium]|nr:hypothetical protein [Nitrospiraceae bacterium]